MLHVDFLQNKKKLIEGDLKQTKNKHIFGAFRYIIFE